MQDLTLFGPSFSGLNHNHNKNSATYKTEQWLTMYMIKNDKNDKITDPAFYGSAFLALPITSQVTFNRHYVVNVRCRLPCELTLQTLTQKKYRVAQKK